MRFVYVLAFAVLALMRGAPARADGGAVRLVEHERGYQISVFSAPNPLRAGPIDISVLVQEDATGTPLSDSQITVRLTPRDRPGPVLVAAATAEAATNKLFRAALVELPEHGWWQVAVSCDTPRGPVTVHFAMEAGAAMPQPPALLPWVGWPFVAVVLFGVHRALVRRSQAQGSQRGEQN